MKFKSLFWLLLFAVLLCLSGCKSNPEAYDSEGHAIRLSDFQGKWIFVNYWATWCEPCLTEMPALNNFYKKNNQKVVVLGVSFDPLSRQALQKIRHEFSLDYPLLVSFSFEKFGVDAIAVLPTTLVFNPQGKLIKILKGPQTLQFFESMLIP